MNLFVSYTYTADYQYHREKKVKFESKIFENLQEPKTNEQLKKLNHHIINKIKQSYIGPTNTPYIECTTLYFKKVG